MWKKITKCLNTLSATLQKDPDSIHLEVEKIKNLFVFLKKFI
jgi:hypothetical protein